MGIRTAFRKVAGSFINLKVSQWVDYDYLKDTLSFFLNQTKALFRIPQAQKEETFKEALLRFELSDVELERQIQHHKHLVILFLSSAACLLLYCFYLIFVTKNYMGACMSFTLILYAISQSFRYHFWLFQMKKEKLGCGFSEWWLALKNRDNIW